MGKLEYKLPIKKDELRFDSKHNAINFVNECKVNGSIKKCGKLEILQNRYDKYIPTCSDNSFDFRSDNPYSQERSFFMDVLKIAYVTSLHGKLR